MTRRTVTITLDPACETPAARDFVKQPVSEVRANRGRFVSLALTIVSCGLGYVREGLKLNVKPSLPIQTGQIIAGSLYCG